MLARLKAGQPTEQDQVILRRAVLVRDGREAKQTWQQIADLLDDGYTANDCRKFLVSGAYRVATQWLAEAGADADRQAGAKVLAGHRARVLEYVPLALDNLREALTDKGDPKRRDKAGELVLGAAGVMEPEHIRQPAVVIHHTVIVRQTAEIAAEDARVVDVTPQAGA